LSQGNLKSSRAYSAFLAAFSGALAIDRDTEIRRQLKLARHLYATNTRSAESQQKKKPAQASETRER